MFMEICICIHTCMYNIQRVRKNERHRRRGDGESEGDRKGMYGRRGG